MNLESRLSPEKTPLTDRTGLPKGHELSMALRRAYLRLHRQTYAVCAEEKLTADQFVFMNVLRSVGTATQSELVNWINSDANTISAMVRRLQQRELVQREAHPNDSRAKVVQLTPQGIELLNLLEEKTLPIRHDMEALYTPEERDQLIEMLRRLGDFGS